VSHGAPAAARGDRRYSSGVASLLAAPAAGIRKVWRRALDEHSTPYEIGWSVGLGALAAFTPFIGLHLWIALALATLFRKNRVWAVLASRLSSTPVLLSTAFVEIELAHRLRTGHYVALSLADIVARRSELFGDWLLGTCLVAPLLAFVAGTFAYRVARRWSRSDPPDAGPS